MGRGTLAKVEDGSEYTPGGPGRVVRSSWGFETGRGTLPGVWNGWEVLRKVRYRSRDHPGGLERVGGPSWRSRTCWGTLPEVLDGSG